MRKFLWFGAVCVAVALVAVVPLTVLLVAIGVLSGGVFITALYLVCSGLACEGERRAQAGEVQRRAHGIAWERARVRREARWQADVEREKRRIESERGLSS